MPEQPPLSHTDLDPSPVLGDTPSPSEGSLTGVEITAREAIRRAVADLGPDADLDAVLAHVQAKFGLTPPRGTAQTYLSLAKKDLRDGILNEPRRRGRPRKAAPNGHIAPGPTSQVEEVIEAVEILRDLCDRLGDDNLRRLLDAL